MKMNTPSPSLNPTDSAELPAHRCRWHFEAKAALRFAAAAENDYQEQNSCSKYPQTQSAVFRTPPITMNNTSIIAFLRSLSRRRVVRRPSRLYRFYRPLDGTLQSALRSMLPSWAVVSRVCLYGERVVHEDDYTLPIFEPDR